MQQKLSDKESKEENISEISFNMHEEHCFHKQRSLRRHCD